MVNFGPKAVELGQSVADSGPKLPMLVEVDPNLGELGPDPAKFDELHTDSMQGDIDRSWPELCKICLHSKKRPSFRNAS